MTYRNRMLRRLWRVVVFRPTKGKAITAKTKTSTELVIAWNHVDAIRQCGGLEVKDPPEPLGFITWDDQPRFIRDTKAGPEELAPIPTLGVVEAW